MAFAPASFDWIGLPSQRFASSNFPLTQGMLVVWENMTPPRIPLSLDSAEDAEALYCWWLVDGVNNFQVVPFSCSEAVYHLLLEEVKFSQGQIIPFWLLRYWQAVKHLQEKYNITTDEGLAGLFLWWLCTPRDERLVRGLRFSPTIEAFLSRHDGDADFPLPLALLALANTRADIAARFPLNTPEGRAGLLLSWLINGHDIAPRLRLELDARFAPYLSRAGEDGIPLFAKAMLRVRPDVAAAFPLATAEQRTQFYSWLISDPCAHVMEHPLLCAVFETLMPQRHAGPPAQSEIETIPVTLASSGKGEQDCGLIELLAYIAGCRDAALGDLGGYTVGGVNIVGFAKGELGLGEDVRMAVRAFDAARLSCSVYNPPYKIISRRGDNTLDGRINPKPTYNANLVFLPGIETYRYYFQQGPALFNGRYNIGAWQWELPIWPQSLLRSLPLAQEFWSSSRFTMETMLSVAKVPVRFMPMVVEIPDFQPIGRASFGLPEDDYLFLYVFDGLSWGARKNPIAVLKAFTNAFPGKSDVRLVVKTMHATLEMPFWREIVRWAAADSRIMLINDVFTRAQVLALFDCCDAYVSLHRAEGFGRTIAEAMLLAKPVIATAWSGNVDFTTNETSYPISGNLIKVQQGEYVFWEGQHWCEPDVDEATEAMRRCTERPEEARALGLAAQRFMRTYYSAEAVGRNYRERLTEIGLIPGGETV